MDTKALLKHQLQMGENLFDQAVTDLSDADFVAALPRGGQTANWILGHLATSEDWFLSKLTGGPLELAQDVHEKYKAGRAPSTNAKDYLPKSEVVALFKDQRKRVYAALEAADVSSWSRPVPEGMPPMFGTVGGTWSVLGTHQFWHFGQLTAIRRMLDKPNMLM